MDEIYAIESFIEYLDNSMIAEEGFKDVMKSAGRGVAKGAKFIGEKVMQFIRMLRDLLRRVIDKIKGIRKETEVDSDKFFYLTKINKVRISAVNNTLKRVQAAVKQNEDVSMITAELKKCNKIDEKWKSAIDSRKSKKIPTNPAAITKILSENNALLKQCESSLKYIEALNARQSGAPAANNSPLYSAINSCLQLVQKTINQANELITSGGGHSDMVKYGQKHAGKDPRMHGVAKRAMKQMKNVDEVGKKNNLY